ncbi:MAG: glycoside hydrolase TIM-barrel-like domain-containing protein [Rickettsiales bacterium]|jgi:hypothetical protein|nr:glycoside hydrolase TIM-barrel-like domain-containing protein [Rickettsiales bacterium]
MTTFIFTQALSALNSKKDKMLDTFNSSPLGELINYGQSKTKWKKDRISGKLSEISIQTSTYNKIIPIVYGRNKLAGNVLWLGTVQEVSNNNTTTLRIGKGQKINQTSIQYLYFLSFAIAICAGEIASVENVWADTALLDMTEYAHRFYGGTSTQMPDPLIESLEGSGNVSAYRNISYIVFENFPLSEFNNRIPNFLFEVTRKNEIDSDNETSLENCVQGINIAPPWGEFALNTTVQYRAGEQFSQDSLDTSDGLWYVLNKNNNSGIADSLLSLDQLTNRLVNCQWFSVPAAFFGNSLDISNCTITPRVTFSYFDTGYPIFTAPDFYSIGSNWNRYNTPTMGKNADGNFRFSSGSSSDASIVSFFQELRSRGKNTVFHPRILMDLEGTPSSRLLGGNPNSVVSFFTGTNGYNNFILHYANLLKNYVDVFLIGSDLEGLTSVMGSDNSFPAVDSLLALAGMVRSIVGGSVKISYAAGHREYHSIGGWFALDKLWASNYIDFVGINAFFPLTDASQDAITKETIEDGWFGGEGYDYITTNGTKTAVEPKYAYKNLSYWWNNSHSNPNGSASAWIPQSKNIWFTEYGFRSVDCSSNEPFRKIGSLPKYSLGSSDFYAQRMAIEATESAFRGSNFVENKFLYCWDIRPYPFFPNRTDIWSDGVDWKYDYCLNGKTGISNANVLIYQLFRDAEIDESLIEAVDVDEFVDGFVVNNSLSVRDVLYLLQKVYFFDCVENEGRISFISTKSSARDSDRTTEIYEDDLIAFGQDEPKKFIALDIRSNNDLPGKVSLIFIDKNNNYDTSSVYAERNSSESDKHDIYTIPVVLDMEKARNVAEISLYSSWLERVEFSFVLPTKYLYLNCSDLVKIHINGGVYLLKIESITLEGDTLRISSTEFENRIYKYSRDESPSPNLEIMGDAGSTYLKILEIPALGPAMLDKIYVFFTLNGQFENWTGANLYFSDDNRKNYTMIGEINTNTLLGRVINLGTSARPYYSDEINRLKVAFHGGIDPNLLENADTAELLNGKNRALYGNEIIQFRNIILNIDGSYEVSGLLRGLYGTEKEIENHRAGERFLILGETLLTQEFDYDRVGFEYSYRALTLRGDVAKSQISIYQLEGKNLRPLAPCHFFYRLVDDTVTVNWEEKKRGYYNWTSGVGDTPTSGNGGYYMEIYDENGTPLEKTYLEERHYSYNTQNRALPKKIRLCQINNFYGKGEFLEVELAL